MSDANSSYWKILFRKTTALLTINMFIINLYLYAILNFAVLYFVEDKHYSTQMASNFASLNALSAFIMILLCGYLTKFLRAKLIYLWASVLIAIFSLGIVFTNHFVIAMALGYGVSLGAFSLLMALTQQLYNQQEIPIACGLVNFGGALGGAVAPTLFALILKSTHSYVWCFLTLAGIMFFSTLLIIPLRDKN